MRLRKIRFTAPALVLGLSSLLIFMVPSIAQAAAPYTCTWTGTGGNSNFSTAANWSGCNSAAPAAGDIINFGVIGSSTQTYTLTNNLGVALGGITYGTSSDTNSIISEYHIDTLELADGAVMTGTYSSNSLYNAFVSVGALQLDGALTITNYPIYVSGNNNLTVSPTNLTIDQNGTATDINPGVSNGSFVVFNPTGAINVNNGAEFGYVADTPPSSVTVQNGSKLEVGWVSTVSAPLTFGGGSLSTNPLIEYDVVSAGDVTLSGTITLTSNLSVDIPQSATLTITGAINGDYTITKTSGSTGTLVINSSNNGSATPNSTSTTATTTTTLSDSQPTVGLNIPNASIILLDGSRGRVEVESGGTLKGTGSMSVLYVDSGGIVSPGDAPGCLTVNGDLVEGGTYQAELDGTTACTGYDQLIVTGSGSTINLTSGILTVTVDSGFKIANGQTFEIINNQAGGAITGQLSYNGTALPEGSTFTVNGVVFKISYKGGGGNNVVLTVVSGAAAPNTGFGLTTANIYVPLLGSLLAAGGIFLTSRRFKSPATKRH